MEICNNNIIDVASDRGAIYLGVWDTLNVRQQQFDVSAWLDAYGDDGVLTVLNQRHTDDLPYEVADVVVENGVATWTFDETDTAVVGEGKAALVYIRAGETIARTVPFATYTAPTIGMTGVEPPDPWEAWYTRILEESAAAQQAASDAGASASNAASAAASAYTQATQAATARSQAVEARNEARAARDEAQTARGEAVTAAGTATGAAETATTAAGTATGAAETATTAAGGAVIAQGKAEDAQRAAETAQGKAEDAQAAAEAAAAEAATNKYAAFATEGVSSATRFRTLLGADGIPVKTALVTQTAGDVPQNWVIRRCGQNLLNPDMIFLRKSSVSGKNGLQLYDGSETQRSLALSEEYIPITPGARLVTRGLTNTVGINVMYYAAFYAADKSFISRYVPPDTRIDWATTAPATAAFVRICVPIQYVSTITEKTGKLLSNRPVQLEITENPSATIDDASPYEAYNGEDTLVTVMALNTPTAPQAMPTTVIGQNTFSLFPQGALTDANPKTAIDLITAAATMDMTYRLDPTLVYNSLKG